MAPRGIVAAATATTFSAGLIAKGVGGAAKILPITFLVIVATVAVYGLTAAPVAKRLGVLSPERTRPVLVGGQPWVIDLARTLRDAGLDVLMWAGYLEQRETIASANLPLGQAELSNWALGQTATLEGITDVYLLTDEDDYNALLDLVLNGLSGEEGPSVYRLAPPPGHDTVITPSPTSQMLFGGGLDQSAMARNYLQGRSIQARTSNGAPADEGGELLFVIDAAGRLLPATKASTPEPRPGDTLIQLGKPGPGTSAPAD
jgi:hypothetical protein